MTVDKKKLFTPAENDPAHDLLWLENHSIPQSMQFMIDLLPTIRKLIKDWPKEKVLEVLDVGAATGAGANLLATLYRSEPPVRMKVDALDIVDNYKKYADVYFKDINYIVGDIFKLDNDRKWDLIICSHTIKHIKEYDKFIEEMKKHSKFFTVCYAPFEEENLLPDHFVSYDMEKIKKLAPTSVEIIQSPRWNHPIDKQSKCVILTFEKIDAKTEFLINSDEQFKIKEIQDLINQRHDYKKAILEITPLLREHSLNGELNYLMAFSLHMLKKNLNDAMAYYDLALKNGFSEFWTRYNRGFLKIALRELESARVDFEIALKINPSHEGIRSIIEKIKKN